MGRASWRAFALAVIIGTAVPLDRRPQQACSSSISGCPVRAMTASCRRAMRRLRSTSSRPGFPRRKAASGIPISPSRVTRRIRETAFRPWAPNTIPRRFCSALALVSDGLKHPIHYSIGETTGMIGADLGRRMVRGRARPQLGVQSQLQDGAALSSDAAPSGRPAPAHFVLEMFRAAAIVAGAFWSACVRGRRWSRIVCQAAPPPSCCSRRLPHRPRIGARTSPDSSTSMCWRCRGRRSFCEASAEKGRAPKEQCGGAALFFRGAWPVAAIRAGISGISARTRRRGSIATSFPRCWT